MSMFKAEYQDFKREDPTVVVKVTLYDDNKQVIKPTISKGKLVKQGKNAGEYKINQEGDQYCLPTKQVERLPSGDYGLELWADNGAIFPSAGFIPVRIHRNADDSLSKIDPTIDLNKVVDDLHQAGLNVVVDDIEMLAPDATPSVTSEVRDGKNHIKLHVPRGLKGDKGPQGVPGPQGDTGTVDNTGLTNAPAFQALQTQVNNSAVGTNLLTGSQGPFIPNTSPSDYDNALYTDVTGYFKKGTTYTISASSNGHFTNVHASSTQSDNIVLWLTNAKLKISDPPFFTIVSSTTTGTTGTTFTWDQPSGYATVRINSYHKESDMRVDNIKIEKGSVATPWCPNPSEILTQSDYAKIQAAIVALGGSLK